MRKQNIMIVLGDDTPKGVVDEVARFSDGGPITFSWSDEDNEDMPITAEYLSSTFNIYRCVLIP